MRVYCGGRRLVWPDEKADLLLLLAIELEKLLLCQVVLHAT